MTLRRWSGRLAAVLAALACLQAPCSAATPIPADARIAPDPGIRRGKLANGMRYAVMHNDSPANMVSIRLVLEVGSYEEEEDERGFAHFLEHMAFRSTRVDPDGAFDNRFAPLGVAFGRDQNAATGLESTIYRVDLPSHDARAAQTVLEWMRGAADGINFDQGPVDLERGVVQAERRAQESPLSLVQRDIAIFQGMGLRGFDRSPAGTEETLRNATPAALRAFYERWYRPENAMVVVTGDAPLVELEAAIAKAFESWKAPGAAGRRHHSEVVPARGLDAFSRSAPTLPSALSACRMSPPTPDRTPTIQRLRNDLLVQMWTGIFGRRLAHIANADDPSLLGGTAVVNHDLPDATIACLIVVPNNGRLMEALALGQAELRRLAAQGPTAQEIEEALSELRGRLAAAVIQASTRNSITLADSIVGAELAGRIAPDPSEALRTFEIAAAGITAVDLTNALAADWSGSGPLIAALGEETPGKDALLAAWTANELAKPLDSYADRAGSEWLYGNFGKHGKVKRRERYSDPEHSRFTFSNGVVLTFKQTAFRENGVEIRVRFGQGERALDPDSRWLASLATELFPSAGLGRMDYEQIGSALTNTTWEFSPSIGTDSYVLSASPLSEQVPRELELLAAYMTDPGFRPSIDAKLPTVLNIALGQRRTEPMLVAIEALDEALYPGKPTMPSRERMMAYRVKDFEHLLRPQLTASPIEVTIVGDIEEKEAIRLVGATFGALPKRGPYAPAAGEGPFRRFPEHLPGPVTARHEGPPEKAAALLMWPLYVATPERRSEEYAIMLLADIFETRLLQRVRVKMGKAYSPSVGIATPDAADEGYLAAALEATPADIAQLAAAAREIGAELAAGKISQQDLDAARKPRIADRLQAQGKNEIWANVLSASLRHPEAMAELLAFESMLNALTPEDLRIAAARWLTRDPLISTALPTARTSGG